LNAFSRPKNFPFLTQANLNVLVYSLIRSLVGAIGAGILYTIFASQMITSKLFPEFHCATGMCDSFADFI